MTLQEQAKKIIDRGVLPKSAPKGAKKAFFRFQFSGYGPREGRRIFCQKAIEQGTGNTLAQRISSVYKKGAKIRG